MKANTPDLLKFKRLQRRLGVGVATLCGHLELLWISTSKNTPQGDIGRFCNEDIAIGCYWDGDPDEFVHALTECGWIDADEKHRLVVHDWEEHCPSYVRGFLARHKREFVKPTKQAAKQDALQAAMEVAIAPCNMDAATKSSQVKPSQVKSSERAETALSTPAHTPDFQKVWARWKKHLVEQFKPLSQSTEESQLMDLARRWPNESDRIAVVEFSIQRQAKNLIVNGDHARIGDRMPFTDTGQKPTRGSTLLSDLGLGKKKATS